MYRQLLKPETVAALDELAQHPRWGETTPADDLDVLASLIVSARARRILQFGTFLGGSALILADLARQADPEHACVVTIDPDPAMNASCRAFAEKAGLSGIITTVDGYSTDPALLLRLRTYQRDWEWDAVYLDTTHQYGQTHDEIAFIAELCGPRTLFLFHDASTFAAETLDLAHQGGVKRAIREWCLMQPRWQHFIFEQPAFGKYGIGAMQKKVTA